ncbi:putative secreted protein [Wickerhamomyces ciferrii]|uniref:Secreted protein n=1 Tax=Wickerhamomyces ciferrii (strain ATCC 14091 / BCRC 22168 / CBS 111 / JCM 3599 / NBRC 0793 / NRRL Y-1031 F-60-10) TaxID=1206466 RepID=K0KAF3_WICCF|nr:uncharacterized protein BN7_1484 [Wickerhamomyces ciferrii]CCH41945.1 putative secreted protein [Wickerhamomyces ciferrii]
MFCLKQLFAALALVQVIFAAAIPASGPSIEPQVHFEKIGFSDNEVLFFFNANPPKAGSLSINGSLTGNGKLEDQIAIVGGERVGETIVKDKSFDALYNVPAQGDELEIIASVQGDNLSGNFFTFKATYTYEDGQSVSYDSLVAKN